MYIQSLKLLNFRNYQNINIDFSKKINIFYGLNGSGKTNIVESIYFLGLTKSFRSSNDLHLIKKGCNYTKILGNIYDDYLNDYMIYLDNSGKKIKNDNEVITKLSDYVGRIMIVLFHPDDLKFIKESPTIRRKVLNISISQVNKNYLFYLNKYNKILKQRNVYLKKVRNFDDLDIKYLDILTTQLIEFGYKVYEIRKNYIDNIKNDLNKYYFSIMNNNSLDLKYVSFYDKYSKDDILSEYKKLYHRDFLLRQTSYGIHKDDFVFYLDGQILKEWGSEGQQKNAVIAYKLAEISYIKKIFNKYPILILDDLFSELDNQKIDNILNLLDSDIQTFITTTEIENIPDNIKKNAKIYYVKQGEVKEEVYG